MTRLHVFLLRTAASAAVLLTVFAIVRVLWYPGAYFPILGADKQFLVLAVATFVIGPVLSAVVYKPGKRNLRFDLAALATVEAAAILTALSLLYLRQPHFAVFTVDRFETVARGEVDLAALPADISARRPGVAPRLIYARMPDDPDVVSQLIDETVLRGQPDIDRRPSFWRPYPEGVAAIKAAALPLDSLLNGDTRRAARMQRWLDSAGRDPSSLRFLPIRGRVGDAVIVLHADIGYPVATLNIDPW
jgi:hypothetical protein